MNKGKVHKIGPEQGYDTTMCNRWYQPRYYAAGVTNEWDKVTCKTCLKAKGKEANRVNNK